MFRTRTALLASTLIFPSLALLPDQAVAQSQTSGTQELLSELQRSNDRLSPNIENAPVSVDTATDVPLIEEFLIGSIIVAGTDGKIIPEYGSTIEQFIGSVANQRTLQQIATTVAAKARAQGYIFASAYVPEQSIVLGGLKIIVDLGKIDKIVVKGPTNSRLVSMLNELENRYATQRDVERRLLLAQDIPGIAILGTDFVREDGLGTLVVQTRKKQSSGFGSFDNYGDSGTGPYRARLDVDHSSIIESDDRLSVGVTATPLQPDELTFISARYANVLTNNGSQLWVTAAAGRTHDNQPGNDWRSRSRYVAAAYNIPIVRSDRGSFWLTAEAAYLNVDQQSASGLDLEDRLTTLSVTASGNTKLMGGRLSGGVSFVRGLNILNATKAGDGFSSRLDGSGVFTKEQVWLNWFGVIGSGFSMRLAGNGQVASRPLLASQEIGLGGIGFGRAYSFYERSGDEGAMGLFELRHSTDNPMKNVDWIQLYGFVDGGVVSNLNEGFGSGGLISSGVGLRSAIGKTEIGMEVAMPVDDARFETTDRSPRFNFSVGYRF